MKNEMTNKMKEYIVLAHSKWLFSQELIPCKKKLRHYLGKVFKLKSWHDDPLNAKPYAMWTLKQIEKNKKKDLNCVEIGCGLGDVIGNLTVRGKKYGFDITEETVRAAKLLHPRTEFYKGSFEDVAIGRIDMLILLNFMHGIKEEELKEKIDFLIHRNDVRMICFDTFLRASEDYPYLHQGQKLFGNEYYLERRSRGFAAAGNNRRYIEFWGKCE